jgi:hypothetical protein
MSPLHVQGKHKTPGKDDKESSYASAGLLNCLGSIPFRCPFRKLAGTYPAGVVCVHVSLNVLSTETCLIRYEKSTPSLCLHRRTCSTSLEGPRFLSLGVNFFFFVRNPLGIDVQYVVDRALAPPEGRKHTIHVLGRYPLINIHGRLNASTQLADESRCMSPLSGRRSTGGLTDWSEILSGTRS